MLNSNLFGAQQFMLAHISKFVWGIPTITLILSTGIFLTVKKRFVQFRGFREAFSIIMQDQKESKAGIKPINALMTSLSATIGTGNIAGVATAITLGGPGAVFWMWVSAILGMATKYSEAYYAVKYRAKDCNAKYIGGPMYYIKLGLGERYSIVANSFAFFGCVAGFGIGNAVQINTIANVNQNITGCPKLITGIAVAAVIALVLIGGIKRISSVAARIVPFMALVYCFSALYCILSNFVLAVDAIKLIFISAFSGKAISGFSVGMAIRAGIARGIFSNEAGLGSAAMAHAATANKNPKNQALIAMLGVFVDTIIICTMTAIIILMSGVTGYDGAVLTEKAFGKYLSFGPEIIGLCIILFAFSSIIGWSYYSEKCLEYLCQIKSRNVFMVLWVLVIPISAIYGVKQVWQIADILNAFMALPNLFALIMLSLKN